MSDVSWGDVADTVATAALVLGAVMNLTTAIGLVRLPDLFSRQHAAAKPQVLGVLLTLLGVGLSLRQTPYTVMLLLVAVFQLLTIPASAHMVTRAGYRAYVAGAGAPPAREDAPADAGPGGPEEA